MKTAPTATGDGERRKFDALGLLADRRAIFVNRGRRALLKRLLAAGTATADAIREAVTLPDEIDPKLFGTVPSPLAKAGIIAADGFVNTQRAQAHARPVRVWVLADADAARRWLDEHPDEPDPAASGAQLTLFGP